MNKSGRCYFLKLGWNKIKIMKILFFIESLRSGGKERRLVELLTYLKKHTDYSLELVLTRNEIHYKYIHELVIPIKIIERKFIKKDPRLFFKFYTICKKFNPDIIHSWGGMATFYALPASLLLGIPVFDNEITDAPPTVNKYTFDYLTRKVNFFFSKYVISNSNAGLKTYSPPLHKSIVINNGINPERFIALTPIDETKKKYGIETSYSVLMVASMNKFKDYDRFLNVALCTPRADVTFIGVGGGENKTKIENRIKQEGIKNVLILGQVMNAEDIISLADVCVLFSTNGEGFSNAIMEYMFLLKPVIADNSGGNKELIINNETGYTIENQTPSEIAELIIKLIDDPQLRNKFGANGRKRIEEMFLIETMGKKFCELYQQVSEN